MAGIVLAFISFFLDWYNYQVVDIDGTLLANWTYNIFSEWSTTSISNSEELKPSNLFVPILVNIILLTVIIISTFGILFKNIESEGELNKLYPFAYINIFLIFLIGFYIFIFPIAYLLSNDLYFPFLVLRDQELEVIYYYWVGPGYIIQLIVFELTFPYAVFYYQTIVRFETERHSPVEVIEKYIELVQEPIDIDKFIAEEELKLRFENITPSEKNIQFRDEFIERRC